MTCADRKLVLINVLDDGVAGFLAGRRVECHLYAGHVQGSGPVAATPPGTVLYANVQRREFIFDVFGARVNAESDGIALTDETQLTDGVNLNYNGAYGRYGPRAPCRKRLACLWTLLYLQHGGKGQLYKSSLP